MNIKYLGVLLVVMLSGAAKAITVLDFEDATPYSGNWLDANYKGINWGDQNFGVISDAGVPGSDYGYETTYHNSYGSPSGIYAAYNTFGLTRSINFNQTIDFIGAYFTSWAESDNYKIGSSYFIWLGGFKDNNYVTGVGVNLAADHYDWVQANIKNIDRLDIYTMGEPEWWLMDDFTYEKSSVPEPSSILMLLTCLSMMIYTRRLRRNEWIKKGAF